MGTLFSLSKSATSIGLDTSEVVLLLFGILLTVGLIGEYAKSERWRKHVKTFELFVIIGVAGELLADGGIFLFSSHLQTIADQEIVDLTVTAGKAKDSAELAAKAADRAKASADVALLKSEAANDAAGKAQDKVGAVANQTKEIDADLARTQYLLSGRSVTDPDSLAKQLKQYKGQIVHFGSYNSEPDESLLCNQLAAAARLAEMKVPQDTCGRLLPVGNALTGVVISGPDIPQTMALAQIILHTSNLGPGGAASAIKAPELNVLVGAKPPFEIGQARGVKVPAKQQTKKKKMPSKP
jgi:hypothetical protein